MYLVTSPYFAAELLVLHAPVTESPAGRQFHVLTVLSGSGHGGFLSGACEVSCRVRAGAARPCGLAAARLHPEPVRVGVRSGDLPGSPAPAVRV